MNVSDGSAAAKGLLGLRHADPVLPTGGHAIQVGGPLSLRLGGGAQAPAYEETVVLGSDAVLPHLVEPDHWQAAEPATGQAGLMSCVVLPAFDVADLELAP